MAPFRHVAAFEDAIMETEAAVQASGFASVEEYLTSSCQAKAIIFSDSPRFWCTEKGPVPSIQKWGEDGLLFSPKRLRAVVSYGSFASCMRMVGSMPSCTTFVCSNIMWASSEELSALCDAITSTTSSIQALHLHRFFLSTDVHVTNTDLKAQIGEALLKMKVSSLLTLSVDLALCSESTIISLFTLNQCAIKSLSLDLLCYSSSTDHSSTSFPFLVDHNYLPEIPSALLDGLAHNTLPLTSLCLIFPQNKFMNPRHFQSTCAMLQSNTTLNFMGINGVYTNGTTFLRLLQSLENNPSLRALSLAYCLCQGEWPPLASILDSLQVNGLINELDLHGTTLHGNATIAHQLHRNLGNSRQVDVLRSQGILKVCPNTIRLFLFGLAFSGKTTLSQSLSLYFSRQNVFWEDALHHLKNLMLKRTCGIEITVLENTEHKVSLWDMAGQREYHSFHDHMFPDLSNRATPSMFVFVWNPIEVDKDGKEMTSNGQVLIKTKEQFRKDLKYWLKFISSKTLRSESFRPKILVAITRADRGLKNIKRYLETKFAQLQEEFNDMVQLDMAEVFEIDARKPASVANLGLHIFHCAEIILEAVPQVYQACDNAKAILGSLVNNRHIPPLVTKEKFILLCYKHLGIDSKDMCEAVALSLNDSGDLVYLTSLELVVIDVPWFCHQIMGNLLRGNFNIHSTSARFSEGFFPQQVLEDLLETTLNSNTTSGWGLLKRQSEVPNMSPRVNGKDVVNLLIGLRLACPQQENSNIFIPSSLSWKPPQLARERWERIQNLYKKGGMRNVQTYLGRRLMCTDSKCTFLTPGIFPLIQVTFYNIFSKRGVQVTLEEDVIAFACDGVDVLVEFCRREGDDHCIDILIWSCLDYDDTLEWMCERVLVKLKEICAEPRGIQGVQLSEVVIRPACVVQFIFMDDRQAVSMQELRKTLMEHIYKKGDNSSRLEKVLYSWQGSSSSDPVRVIDLLGEVETNKIIESCKDGLIEAAEILGSNAEEKCSFLVENQAIFSSTVSRRERELIYREVRKVQKDIEHLCKVIEILHNSVHTRLKELFTFAEEGERGRLPRFPIITRDCGLVRRVVTTIMPGLESMRLELLCEHHPEHHPVEGQLGIRFVTLGDGLLKCALPYINTFLKVACVAVKVGAHIAAGYGDQIPNFAGVLALIEDTGIQQFPYALRSSS